MLKKYTFNFTLEIASPMDFLKEEIFFICRIYKWSAEKNLPKQVYPNASGSSLFACIKVQCLKIVWYMAM